MRGQARGVVRREHVALVRVAVARLVFPAVCAALHTAASIASDAPTPAQPCAPAAIARPSQALQRASSGASLLAASPRRRAFRSRTTSISRTEI